MLGNSVIVAVTRMESTLRRLTTSGGIESVDRNGTLAAGFTVVESVVQTRVLTSVNLLYGNSKITARLDEEKIIATV